MLNHEKVDFYGDRETKSDFIDDWVAENAKANAQFILKPNGDSWELLAEGEEIPPGSIHVMKFSGAVMKDDWCGVPGTESLQERFITGQSHPNIIGTVFSTDTGGGHVDGTFEYVDVIAAAEKPVVGYVNGMSCSAGYAMMSRCTEIMLCHQTAMVGSIGTAVSFYNFTERYKKKGIELIYINAESSPDKNQDYFEALAGNIKPMQEDLNYLNEIFQTSVKAGRPGIKKEAITGKCYRGQQAISLGMADSIGTLSDAVNRVEELANQ
jgi:protease-4